MLYLPHHYPGGSVTFSRNCDLGLQPPKTQQYHMVRTGYSVALEYCRITPVWDIPAFEAFLNNLLPSQDETYFQLFTDMLKEVINDSPLFTVFSGVLRPLPMFLRRD